VQSAAGSSSVSSSSVSVSVSLQQLLFLLLLLLLLLLQLLLVLLLVLLQPRCCTAASALWRLLTVTRAAMPMCPQHLISLMQLLQVTAQF
jgi:hypothetical protein